MSERYSKVFALSENLYATGSPIVIEAGALQKDNQTGSILAQIKMKNISAKVIKAVKVKLTLLDVAGNVLADGVEQQYLDLSVSRDESFGSKSAIRLKEFTTRSFSVNISEVVFEDGNVWSGTANLWETLSEPAILIDYFNDEELEKQFEIKYGSPCNNVLLEEKDLWYCACGALNKDNEPKCHKCGKSLKTLKELDISALKSEKEKRLENERILAEEKAERERKEAEIAKAEFEAKKKRFKKTVAIVVPIVCVLIVGIIAFNYFNKNILIPNGQYNDAVTLMNSGNYEEAIVAFETLNGYKDSKEQIKVCHNMIEEIESDKLAEIKEILRNLKEGDCFNFGVYEQDDNTTNGKEDIEWLVLEVSTAEKKALVISKYALDGQEYNEFNESVTWEYCDLRKWLNGDFINTAFSAKESTIIPIMNIPADKNPSYNTNVGNATKDRIFLLSIKEVQKYFPSTGARMCQATPYADTHGAYSYKGYCDWLTRTTGMAANCVACVANDGQIYMDGYGILISNAIRPAMWVSLD